MNFLKTGFIADFGVTLFYFGLVIWFFIGMAAFRLWIRGKNRKEIDREINDKYFSDRE